MSVPKRAVRSAVSVAAAAVLASACFIQAGDLVGKQCRTNVDCMDPYVCVAARASGARTCELLRGPDTQSPGGSGPVDWCKDVQPLLARSCVANCHGSDTSGSSQLTFRLDAYAFDGGFPLGAFAKASRIRVRVEADDMPPVGFSPRLSVEEGRRVTRWVDLGAPECVAAADGGTGDAGSGGPDGGTDGGTDGG